MLNNEEQGADEGEEPSVCLLIAQTDAGVVDTQAGIYAVSMSPGCLMLKTFASGFCIAFSGFEISK